MKEIKGYEGLYSVEEDGRVWSHRSKKYLKPSKNAKTGYWKVNLSNGGQVKTRAIHRLVAETYIPNPDNLPDIDHKDRNKDNNHVSNLKWTTKKDNCRNTRTNRAVINVETQEEFGSIAAAAETVADQAKNSRSAEMCII